MNFECSSRQRPLRVASIAVMSDAESPLPTTGPREDWPSTLTATLVGYVDTVRNATTGKALVASRYLVYFLAIGLIALVAIVVLLILAVRLLAVGSAAALPFIDQGEVWFAYIVLGLLFSLAGIYLWRKKEA